MSKDTNFQDIFAHFTKKVSQEIVDYARDVVFLKSRYIFTWRQRKQQYGYCTHCKNEFETESLKHNSTFQCPCCSSKCKVKASGISRKKMIDDAYFVYYEKSIVNPQGITARGIYAVRDYRGDFRKVETLFETKALYVFEPGNSVMIRRPYLYYTASGNFYSWGSQFEKAKSIRSECDSSMSSIPCYCSEESIRAAVMGTPFQYSTWESYPSSDMVRFFDLYAHYPCVEYLTKLKFGAVVKAKLNDSPTYSAINWRGKTPLKVLKLSKQDLNEVRTANIPIDPLMLKLFQISKKDKSNLSFKDIYEISRGYGFEFKDLKKILKYTTLGKAHSYIKKQYGRKNIRNHYYRYQILSTWRDYIADCVDLDMDLTQESVLFPSDLHKAHQATIEKIKFKADEALNAQIRNRLASLKKYNFEANGFILRPAADTAELIREGNELSHCVGRYAKSYANGETNILLLRKASEPDKPFYTVEVRNGHITQCRGFKNCSPTDEVKAFIDLFTVKKLLTKKQVRVAQPA